MNEQEIDQETLDEMNAIANMVKYADKQGLLCEVIFTFAQDLYSGTTIKKASAYALNEWDC